MARLRQWNDGKPVLKLTAAELERWQVDRSAELQPEPRRTELSHVRQFYR